MMQWSLGRKSFSLKMRAPATKEASTDPLRVQATMDTIASGSSKARK